MPRTHWATFKLVWDSLYPCLCHIARLCFEIVRHYIFVASIGRRLGISHCMTLPRRDPAAIHFVFHSNSFWHLTSRGGLIHARPWCGTSLSFCVYLSVRTAAHTRRKCTGSLARGRTLNIAYHEIILSLLCARAHAHTHTHTHTHTQRMRAIQICLYCWLIRCVFQHYSNSNIGLI